MSVTRLLERLSESDKAELLVELSTGDIKAYDESEQFEIDPIVRYTDGIEERMANWGKHQGMHFGYKSIDDMTLGMTDGEVLLLSGDSNHGKTQFALNLAFQQAQLGNTVFFVTLEMTQDTITDRLVKIAIQNGMTLEEAINLPILLQRTRKLDYKNVPNLVRQGKSMGAKIVFIDHIHSFRPGDAKSKTQEVAAISDAIKRAALDNLIPVVALAQCRKLEDAQGKPRKPNKNDLKDASELYQDCDMCIMVWRDKFTNNGANSSLVEARIWKNRLRDMRGEHMVKYFESKQGAQLVEVTDYSQVESIFPGAKKI